MDIVLTGSIAWLFDPGMRALNPGSPREGQAIDTNYGVRIPVRHTHDRRPICEIAARALLTRAAVDG
ncbi:MAG TPA: hypothetical protein VJS12_26555 [Steroidobacteraceae bacterium]|nr:hypothetical protein [Steroidobacteraceae bacterium]